MAMKVQTVIDNNTQYDLVLRVGNHNCYTKVAKIVPGGEYKIKIDVNWTYQEFSLEPARKHGPEVRNAIVSSDDCCDNERMRVTLSDGKLHVDKVARRPHVSCEADPRPVEATANRPVGATPANRPVEATPASRPVEAAPASRPDEATPASRPVQATTARFSYFTWLPAWPKFNWRFWSNQP